MKNALLWKEAIMCNCQIDTFHCQQKDEWDAKEDTSRSMKNALYVLWYAKGTSRDKATLNSEKSSP